MLYKTSAHSVLITSVKRDTVISPSMPMRKVGIESLGNVTDSWEVGGFRCGPRSLAPESLFTPTTDVNDTRQAFAYLSPCA